MEDLRISLSDRQQAFVDEQVAAGDYTDPTAYVAALSEAEAQAKLETLLLAGLEGEQTHWTDADAEALLRLAQTGR